jgi:hypothetical protein
MAFYVHDRAADQAVRKLARIKGKSLTETIRKAVDRSISGSVPLTRPPVTVLPTLPQAGARVIVRNQPGAGRPSFPN